jgi:cytochrome c
MSDKVSLRRAFISVAVAGAAWASSSARGHDGVQGDALRGEAIFASKCAVCHSKMAGWHKEGPSLAGVFGRRAGTAPDFNGYRALRGMNVVWSDESLDAWLADPKGFSGRDSAMSVKLADAQTRADVIAYLRTLR